MNFIADKHLPFSIVLLFLLCIKASAQTNPVVKDSSAIKGNFLHYHLGTPAKISYPFQRVDYTRPNNQLMSWPDYPLTIAEIKRRDEEWKQDHKLSNIIAKDIVETILSKKKPTAVVPKF